MERFDALTALAITQRYGVTLFYAVPPVLLALTPDAAAQAVRPLVGALHHERRGAAAAGDRAGACRSSSGVARAAGLRPHRGLADHAPESGRQPRADPARLGRAGTSPTRRSRSSTPTIRPRSCGAGRGRRAASCAARTSCRATGRRRRKRRARCATAGCTPATSRARTRDGYMYIVDRKKEMIKYKGFGIAPAELEALLHEHPAVADCAVVPKRDAEAGEIPRAFVVLRAPAARSSADELMQFVAGARRRLQADPRRRVHRRDPQEPVRQDPAPRAARSAPDGARTDRACRAVSSRMRVLIAGAGALGSVFGGFLRARRDRRHAARARRAPRRDRARGLTHRRHLGRHHVDGLRGRHRRRRRCTGRSTPSCCR